MIFCFLFHVKIAYILFNIEKERKRFMAEYEMNRAELEKRLNHIVNKTLGEVDEKMYLIKPSINQKSQELLVMLLNNQY